MSTSFWRFAFRSLAVAFAVTGLTFFLFPHQTINVMNAAGAAFGLPEAPPMGHRFWLSLGSAYMAVVTVLAWLIAVDPPGRRPMMLALAAGKATSSLTCLGYVISDAPYFIYWANFVVDLSLALVALWAYAATAKLAGGDGGARVGGKPDAPSTPGSLGPTLSAMVGPTDPELLARLTGQVRDYFASLGPQGSGALRGILTYIEWAPVLAGPRRKRFSRLNAAEKQTALEHIEAARFLPLRLPLHAFKLIVMLHYYEHPEVQRGIGFDPAYLAGKLAAARRARAEGGHAAH